MDTKKLVGNSAQKSGVHSFACPSCFVSTSAFCFVCPYTDTRRLIGAIAFRTECRVQLLSHKVGGFSVWTGRPPPWDVDVEMQVFSAKNPQLSKTLSFKPGTGQNICT